MRFLLNLLPLLFLAGASLTGYSLYTAEEGLLPLIPLTVSLISAFIVSLAWRISPAGSARKINGVCLMLVLAAGIYFSSDPSSVRTIWVFLSILILISVHAALFALAAVSFLFNEARKIILLLPVIASFIGLAGLFIWNGTLVLCGIGLIAAIIFALLATLFGLPKKAVVHPEDN